MCLVGVVVRRYIRFLILLIPTPLVYFVLVSVIIVQFYNKELLLIIRLFW